MGKTKIMANTSFAGLGGGVVAGAAVAVAVAITGYIIYDRVANNPPEDQTVEAVLQPKPEVQADQMDQPAAASKDIVEPAPEAAAEPADAAQDAGDNAPNIEAAAPEAAPSEPPVATEDIPPTEEVAADTEEVAPAEEVAADTEEVAPAVEISPPPPVVPVESTADAQQESPTEAAAEDAAPAAEDVAETAPLLPPRFDVVRVDADGNALVAGNATPESEIAILLDRAEIATTAADRAGKFVSLFAVPSSSVPRSITLVMTAGNIQLASAETVVIEPVITPAPEPAPVVVAENTTTETAPSAEAPAPAAQSQPETGTETPAPAASENEVVKEITTAVAPEAAPQTAPDSNLQPTAEVVPETPQDTAPVAAETPVETAAQPAEDAPKVPAVAPRVLIADADGVRVLSDPSTQRDISIDTISYTASGNAVVAGRGQVEAVVRIYLNSKVTAETGVNDNGTWRAELLDVTPGVYTLRADQLDAKGTVISRVETPFKRESQEVLAAVQPPVVPAADPATPVAVSPSADTQTTAASTEPATSPDPAAVGTARLNVVTVQPGFTLWGIAAERYGDGFLYVKVFDANAEQIRDPDLIYPGQVFTVPE